MMEITTLIVLKKKLQKRLKNFMFIYNQYASKNIFVNARIIFAGRVLDNRQ